VLGEHLAPIFIRDGRAHALAVSVALLVSHQLPAENVGIAMQGRGKRGLGSRHFHGWLRQRMH
jgi:hypothetical protein